MLILDRIRTAFRVLTNSGDLAFAEYARRFFAGDDMPDEDGGTEDVALKYTAVFACCRVLSETYASTPLQEYQRQANGDRQRTDDTGLLEPLRIMPNAEMSAFNYHEMSMMQLNTGGNFYAEKLFNAFGDVVQFRPIDHSRVKVKRAGNNGVLTYEIDKADGTGDKVSRTRKKIFHIPGLSLDGIVGLSPLTYAASAIQLGKTYEAFGRNFYKNGALTSGIFEHPGDLKDDAYERLRGSIEQDWTGLRNSGRPMLLEDGLKYTPMSISPIDAQLLESKKFQIEDICRIYRVPMHLVQNLDKATNNNIEHQSLEFVMYTMLPWFKRVEAAISAQLLTRSFRQQGYFFEFNMAGLVRGDLKSRYEAYQKGRQWGWLSVNDIRRFENMNSIGPDGDIYLTPLNMVPAGEEQKQVDAVHKEIDKLLSKVAQG